MTSTDPSNPGDSLYPGELQVIVNSVLHGVCVVGPDGRCRYINEHFCDTFGYSQEELLGRPVCEILRSSSVPAERWLDHSLQVRELLFEHKSGRTFAAEVKIRALGGPDGACSLAYFVRDISSAKSVEEVLRKTEKLASAGRMAAAIAHEVNNPLEGVVNLLYLLQNESLSSEGREYLTLVETEIERVSRIARQTLGFYRDTGQPEAVDLRELVNMVLDVHSVRRPNVRISRRYRNVVPVVGYLSELQQVVHNLVGNAMDAGATRLWVHVNQSGELARSGRAGVRITIADDGSGIEPFHRKSLFNPFFTTKGERGTGLGLWVSRGIVLRHEGSIQVRTTTTPGRSGTCFTIFLPI